MGEVTLKERVQRVMRELASPVSSYFDARFQELHERVTRQELDLRRHLDKRLDSIEDRLSWVEDRVNDRAGDLGARLDQLETRVTVDTQTMAELAATSRRGGEVPGEVATPAAVDRLLADLVGLDLADLGPGAAAFLDWAMGHTGPSGQAGTWFNPPVTLLHGEGTVRHNEVNERIVEIPYALGAAAALPAGARVLDVGAAESTLALSFASLGLEVTATDLRPYPIEHPRLRSVVGPLEEWSGPEEPFDAAFCVSSIEHFGLGAYGEAAGDTDLDRRVIERIAGWLRPEGELVLTAPYGEWELGAQQRVYDSEHLDALLEGWRAFDRRVCVQTGPDRWERADGKRPPEGGRRGVVLVRATPIR
jgi:2-polyprenyl-3-methyl-5-hydroxy-6-metoxy-1,4-benzoquinol methylase